MARRIHARQVHEQERWPASLDPVRCSLRYAPVAVRHLDGLHASGRKERPELLLSQYRHRPEPLPLRQRERCGEGDVGVALRPVVPVDARDLRGKTGEHRGVGRQGDARKDRLSVPRPYPFPPQPRDVREVDLLQGRGAQPVHADPEDVLHLRTRTRRSREKRGDPCGRRSRRRHGGRKQQRSRRGRSLHTSGKQEECCQCSQAAPPHALAG